MEGDGRATVYAGGWTDYQTQRGLVLAEIAAEEARAAQGAAQSAAVKAAKVEKASAKPTGKALSFTEKHRLEALPEVIAKLEAEIVKLTEFLSAPDLFAKEPAKFKKKAPRPWSSGRRLWQRPKRNGWHWRSGQPFELSLLADPQLFCAQDTV